MQCETAPSSSSSNVLRPLNTNRPTSWFAPSFRKNTKKDKLATTAEDFVMISPIKARTPPTPASRFSAMQQEASSSSPPEDSPTPACGVASATARLRLDESPIRRGKELDEDSEAGSPQLPPTPLLSNGPPPQPLFPPLRTSQSQDCGAKASHSRIPRLSTSHPIRARSSTDAQRPLLGSKKAVSLDAINSTIDEPFGNHPAPTLLGKKSRPPSLNGMSGSFGGRAHKRHNSGEQHTLASISRSAGQKSGLALHLPEFGSNSSISTMSTTLTPPVSAFSPAEPPIFEDVKPLAEAFENPAATVLRKFKPRDSGVSMGDEDAKPAMIPPPSVMKPPALGKPQRPAMLKRTSSMGDERTGCQTPSITGPSAASAWPNDNANAFDFLGESGKGLNLTLGDKKQYMPDTPVKKNIYGHTRGGSRGASLGGLGSLKGFTQEPPPRAADLAMRASTKIDQQATVPKVTLTTTSPRSDSSPTRIDVSPSKGAEGPRVGLLRRLSNGASDTSEDEGTPTKGGGERAYLSAARTQVTPTPSPGKGKSTSLAPRLSLPAFANPKQHKTLHHRQSHPAPNVHMDETDVFEAKFLTLDTLGKGAFSTVLKVQERDGDGLYAVKKARGVFDGVRDRTRHLEEVDILRHLSRKPCPHVIKFEDAWEQNRQLFIQTELCLGSLAFFLEEYGRVVERMDEGRVWKIVRELSDGINHIHGSGVIHFDIKPANILISATGSLKIGDFGLATRWPRISAEEILAGSGLGGTISPNLNAPEKLEREGDRVYMPPEMLRGVFVQAADVFSFGLVILEVSTNICVPDGGPAWQALRSNDFTVVDLSQLSPALTDLITQCMNADPEQRPPIDHVVNHPIVQRARNGKEALAPEEPRWVADVLSGGSGFGFWQQSSMKSNSNDGDVEMQD